MPLFVVDTSADAEEGQKRYIATFFRDVRSLNGYRVVVGGTKMDREIKRKDSLFRVIKNLRDVGRLTTIDRYVVDTKSEQIESRVLQKLGVIPASCDDFHIFAICIISGCQNIITSEQRIRDCVELIRAVVGHDYCPQVRLIRDEVTYLQLKNTGQL